MELDLQKPSVVCIIKDNTEGLDWYTVMQKVEAYPEEEAKFIDKLLEAEDVNNVLAVTREEKTFRKLFSCILDSITMIRKNDLPEVEHTFRNVVPLLDAMIVKNGYFWIKYDEQSLVATATGSDYTCSQN
ncbi:hypothetical protein Glove_468g4 [Diversispora epigaea]|uniref:Uncharacterized protein n=1 Tax=Diversispora epigaea TaxID=1348612 RepID=A0A397GNP8_9GLOM|nr:hypothetical protein Glove_468g4 [Diversispora epigaea]